MEKISVFIRLCPSVETWRPSSASFVAKFGGLRELAARRRLNHLIPDATSGSRQGQRCEGSSCASGPAAERCSASDRLVLAKPASQRRKSSSRYHLGPQARGLSAEPPVSPLGFEVQISSA